MFIVDETYIPSNFLVDDVVVDGKRHLVFATAVGLSLLSRAERWFIDGTFKVVKAPFHQLLSIHVFVRRDGAVKQVPLCYVLMSGRRKRDYRSANRNYCVFAVRLFAFLFIHSLKQWLPNGKLIFCLSQV